MRRGTSEGSLQGWTVMGSSGECEGRRRGERTVPSSHGLKQHAGAPPGLAGKCLQSRLAHRALANRLSLWRRVEAAAAVGAPAGGGVPHAVAHGGPLGAAHANLLHRHVHLHHLAHVQVQVLQGRRCGGRRTLLAAKSRYSARVLDKHLRSLAHVQGAGSAGVGVQWKWDTLSCRGGWNRTFWVGLGESRAGAGSRNNACRGGPALTPPQAPGRSHAPPSCPAGWSGQSSGPGRPAGWPQGPCPAAR